MGVSHCHFDFFMTSQFLNRPYIGSRHYQARDVSVPQGMKDNLLAEPRCIPCPVERLVITVRAKNRLFRRNLATAPQNSQQLEQPTSHRVSTGFPILAVAAFDNDFPTLKVHVFPTQRGQFPRPKSRVHCGEHECRQAHIALASQDQPMLFIRSQKPLAGIVLFEKLNRADRVFTNPSPLDRFVEKVLQAGEFTVDRSVGFAQVFTGVLVPLDQERFNRIETFITKTMCNTTSLI
jgi:hypothetical protein